MAGVFIWENTVRYFTLASELIFFLICKYKKKNIFGPALDIGHKEMFLTTLVEITINVFSRHI